MNTITFPNTQRASQPAIFLGGFTARGDWQKQVIEQTKDLDVTFVNSARDDWDITPPTPSDVIEHITWEMREIEKSSCYFIFIPADAKSPTVLLELGLALANPKAKTFVVVEKGYSHFEHARISSNVAHVFFSTSLEDGIRELRFWLKG